MRHSMLILLCSIMACCSAAAASLNSVTATLVDEIRKDYSYKTAHVAGRPTIILQEEQSLIFKQFAVVPFMYLPNNADRGRECVVRILSHPDYKFVQDLTIPGTETVGIPCNGVLAIGIRDLTSDNYSDLTILYDFATRGNPDLKPYLAIYRFDAMSGTFLWDGVLSEKAGRKDPATIKEAYRNLKRK